MARTMIVDDEEDMRVLLRLTIDRENRGLVVVGEASSGEEAIAIHQELAPDIVVLDQRMPGLTGVETARALLAEAPDLGIVLYSAFLDAQAAGEAEGAGVRHCVKKGDSAGLIRALRALLDGLHRE